MFHSLLDIHLIFTFRLTYFWLQPALSRDLIQEDLTHSIDICLTFKFRLTFSGNDLLLMETHIDIQI